MPATGACLVIFFITVWHQTLQKTMMTQNQFTQYEQLKREEGNIVFPDSAGRRSNRALPSPGNRLTSKLKPPPRTPSCPDNQTFCDNVDDYPLEHIKALLKKQHKLLLDKFFVDKLPSPTFVDKFGPDPDIKICRSEETIEYPKKEKTLRADEFIVNTDEHHQGIRMERCINPGRCNIPGSLPLGYASRCVQKTITRELVVFNKKGAGFITKPFEIPSCCSCVISLEMERFALPPEDEPTADLQHSKSTPRNNTMALKATPRPPAKQTDSKSTAPESMGSKPTLPSPNQTHVADEGTKKTGSHIVFPDSSGRRPSRALPWASSGNRSGSKLPPKSSSCPDNQTFCDNVHGYPLEEMKALLRKQPKILLDQFIVDELSTSAIIDKFGAETDANICASVETVEYPEKFNAQGINEFIVNTKEHRQGIRMERCINPGRCNIPGSLPFGYTSHCVQKTITRVLVVFDKNGAGFVTKPFEIPSCCSCVISLEMERFALPPDHERTADLPNSKTTPRNNTIALKASPRQPTTKPISKSTAPNQPKSNASKPT